MSTPKKIVLKSSDGETFEVEETVALESQTIKHMIEDDCADNTIPLPNVTSKILAKVIEYCRKHVEASGAGKAADDVDKDAADEEALKKWDAKFVEVDQGVLFDLILCSESRSSGKLSEHQEPARFDMPDGGGHDQGKDSRGNPQDL
ncbi:hypothetical protein C3L33_19495, partial [Rhododendron williamsianum]